MMLEDEHDEHTDSPQVFSEFQQLSKEELENALQEAIENEDYERASLLRDEINKRTN
jgi:protein-arginine kinase activator protein McsA